MKLSFKNGQTSIILRVRILDTTSVIGAGKTGLTFSSAGLIISTIADNEASATTYTQAGSTIETITTLGTFAAPTANKCRFKEVDATNHPGLYEIQIADERWALSGARSAIVSLPPVSGLGTSQVYAELQLTAVDPQDAVSFGLTGVKANLVSILGTALTETAGQIAAAFKQFFNIAAPTSTMNEITLVDAVTTVDTTTNTTNAPTTGDFTADMKASLDAATPDLDAAALAKMFTVDTGETGATAVPGSVVAEVITTTSTDTSSFSGAAAVEIDAIKAKTDLIAVSTPMYLVSPVLTNLTVTIKNGDDYKYADGRALFQALSFANAPSLVGGSVQLRVQIGTTVFAKAGTALTASTCYVELTSAEVSGSIGVGNFTYDLQATLSNGDIVTIASGAFKVLEDVR